MPALPIEERHEIRQLAEDLRANGGRHALHAYQDASQPETVLALLNDLNAAEARVKYLARSLVIGDLTSWPYGEEHTPASALAALLRMAQEFEHDRDILRDAGGPPTWSGREWVWPDTASTGAADD